MFAACQNYHYFTTFGLLQIIITCYVLYYTVACLPVAIIFGSMAAIVGKHVSLAKKLYLGYFVIDVSVIHSTIKNVCANTNLDAPTGSIIMGF